MCKFWKIRCIYLFEVALCTSLVIVSGFVFGSTVPSENSQDLALKNNQDQKCDLVWVSEKRFVPLKFDMEALNFNFEENNPDYDPLSLGISSYFLGSTEPMYRSLHRVFYLQDRELCLASIVYLGQKDGIVYVFDSLEDLEDGYFSEEIGYIEGEKFHVDEEKFKASIVFSKPKVDGDDFYLEFNPSEIEVYFLRK